MLTFLCPCTRLPESSFASIGREHLTSSRLFCSACVQPPEFLRKSLKPVAAFLRRKAIRVLIYLVSFAAVIRVVTQCSSPTNGCSLELYIPFLKLTNKDQASISWKPGPLAANVTRNMIGAAANSYMHVVGSP